MKPAKKATEDATDRGWAWVVLVAATLNWAIILGTSFSFGIYYVSLLQHFRRSMFETAWIGSVNTLLVFSSGPIAKFLAGFFGYQKVIILGSFVSATGCIASVFATEVWQLILTYGIVTGLGFGIAYTPSIGTVGFYFNRWRPVALSVVQAGVGIGCLIYAPLFQVIIEHYGWQGGMIISSGLCLNMCVTGCLMRPISKLAGFSRRQSVVEMFDLPICCDIRFIILCLNNFLWNAGFIIVFVLLVDYLVVKQMFLEKDAAIMLSIIGISNTVGRPIAGFLGKHKRVSRLTLFNCATAFYGCLCFLYVVNHHSFYYYAAISFFFGFGLGMQCGVLPSIVTDLFGVRRLVASFGYLMISNGSGNLVGPPLAGFLVDRTGSYHAAFYLAAAMILGSTFLMVLLPLAGQGKHEPLPQGLQSVDTGDEETNSHSNQ